MRRPLYSVLCQVPVGVRLVTGFLVAGLIAVLAAGCVGVFSTQAADQADPLENQLSAANAELTTALLLLQANESSVHLAIEDVSTGQPNATFQRDQALARGQAAQFVSEITIFVRSHLFAQQPAQEEHLHALAQGEAVEQQRGLVMSITDTWQRYDVAQTQVLQDLQANQLASAEMLARFQLGPLESDVLSALDSLIQFQEDLAVSVQHAAGMQLLHQQQAVTLLGASAALLLILLMGLLVTMSLLLPLRQLRKVTQAVAAGEIETRAADIGHDEIAVISSQVNDWLTSIDRLLAEVSRQHHGQLAAAEFLVSEVNGGDAGVVRSQVAEVGDPLKVLDAVCYDVVTRFQGVVSSAQAAAQQLETIALRMQSQAERLLLDAQNLSIEVIQEQLTTAQQLQALSHVLAEPLTPQGQSVA